jgi:hypothetical protein
LIFISCLLPSVGILHICYLYDDRQKIIPIIN